MSVLRRACLALSAATVVVVTSGAGSASASTLSTAPDPDRDNETLARYVAAAGEVNDVTVTSPDEHTVQLHDAGATITTGANCTSLDAHTARCASPDRFLDFVALQLGDGNDRAESQGEFGKGLLADAGSGADTLIGSLTKADELDGGGGHDTLRGRGNQDTLIDGDDPRHPDADMLDGGGGRDTVSYANRTDRLFVDLGNPRKDGERGEDDTLIAIQSVIGGSADDRLSGSGGFNDLEGMGGDDRLEGRGGSDSLHGGGGHDVLLGRLGDDFLVGGSRHDRLYGAQGDDELYAKSGGDDLDCGRAFDTALRPRAADFLEPRCDRVDYGHFDASAYPVKHHRSSVDFDFACPRRRLPYLHGSVRIREEGGRRRTLGYKRVRHSGHGCRTHPSRGLTVRVSLNGLGRRLASRGKGIRSTISLRGYSFRDVDWTIELHNG